MTLYFDLDAGFFVSGPGTRDRIDSLTFKRGDTCRIDLRFVSGITVQELATGATGKIGMKEQGEYDADYVAAATSWTKTGTGTSTVYSFDLNLATTALNTLLADDGTEGNDVASVALMFELEFVEDGITTSSPTLTATVYNDVIKGDESGPTDITDGTPVNFVANFYETSNGGGGNKDIRFVQVDDGAAPTVVLSPGGLSTPLSVAVSGRTITVTCPTAIGSITTTASAVISAINGNGSASAILTASNKSGSDGSEPMALSVGPWTLAGGVTATSGFLGTMKVDSSYLYVVCSVTDGVPLWKKIALSAL